MKTNECLFCARVPLGQVMIETFDLFDDIEIAKRIAYDSASLLRIAWEKDRFKICGKKPTSLLSGAIYISSILNKQRITQIEISRQLDVSEPSIRKSYLLLIDITNIDFEWFEGIRNSLGYVVGRPKKLKDLVIEKLKERERKTISEILWGKDE
jgi:transcription initiation factor TFIIIB Brf1 subunit/transcription initiation factor TFIIB